MKAMLPLFRACSWPYLKKHWLRSLLALVAVTSAVVLFVSLRILENSLLVSIEKSTRVLSGSADVCVTHGIGIEAEALARIEQIQGLRAAPVIEQTAFAPDLDERVLVVGMDFVRDAKLRGFHVEGGSKLGRASLLLPRRLILSGTFARSRGLKLNHTLRLQTPGGMQDFRVAGFFPHEEAIGELPMPVMVLNVRSAQHCFDRRGRYDRIDVRLGMATVEQLAERLGPGYLIQPLPRTNPVLSYQLQQFELLLNPVTVLALLTAIFLIHNSMYLSVVERVRELVVFRAVGAERSQILLLVLGEAVLMGALAAALGCGLGILVSQFLLDRTADLAGLLVQVVDVREMVVPADALVLGPLIGVLAAASGAIVPAWLAFRVQPAEALVGFQPGERRRVPVLRQASFATLGFLFASLSGGFFLVDRRSALCGLVLGFCSAALAMPALVIVGSRALGTWASRVLRVEGHLALDNIVSFPARTSLTVVAFATSLSMVVAVSGCLSTLENQVRRFVERMTPYDLVMQVHDLTLGLATTPVFSESLRDEIAELPQVGAVCGGRNVLLPYRGDWVMLAAYDTTGLAEIIDGLPNAALESQLQAGGIAVSVNFAYFHQLHVGDSVELPTPAGLRPFRVLRVVDDYAWPRGTVLLDRGVYRSLWSDGTLTYLHVGARPGVAVDALREEVLSRLHDRYQISAYTSAEVRTDVSKMLRQWFRVADAQTIVAEAVGAIGIANTVLISLLSRRRHVALLRAIGASSWQIYASLAWEAGLLGALSALTGAALGLWQMWWPASWVVQAEMGFRLAPVVPWDALATVFVLGVVISLAASLVPISYARRTNLVAAIAYE
ncbi:MAG TPA: FtsX-like permease family protein [Pirellulales bacterium]|nr:FtsX-like permease family protein [Pirellulales bacterium]